MHPHASSVALCAAMAIPDAVAGSVPEWLHLLPATPELRTVDGRGPYRIQSLQAIASAFQPGDKLVLDENHATDLIAPKGGSAPAVGWIVALQVRETGLWGRIEWNGLGRRLMVDKAYRGLSPAIVHDSAGNVLSVARASLTNTPNLKGLTALHSQSRDAVQQPLNAADRHVIALMGLSEDEYRASLAASNRRLSLQASKNAPLAKDGKGLDAADRKVIALMGLSEDDYLASLRKIGLSRAAL